MSPRLPSNTAPRGPGAVAARAEAGAVMVGAYYARRSPRRRPGAPPATAYPCVIATRPEPHVFLLSPAHCGGERAGLLLRARAEFPLAREVRSPGGAPLADVFSFLSGLYFRGKIAYARAFARPPQGLPPALVI